MPTWSLAISYSGESDEILMLLPALRRQGNTVIAMTGRPQSSLAREADVHLDVSVPAEACPLHLAPTSSTTASLALGDALAVALLEARGFTADDFARSHPAGSLGRRLLLHIDDVMHTGEALPGVGPNASVAEALVEMSRKRLGMTAVVDDAGKLVGIFTDGDLRRALDQGPGRAPDADQRGDDPRSAHGPQRAHGQRGGAPDGAAPDQRPDRGRRRRARGRRAQHS